MLLSIFIKNYHSTATRIKQLIYNNILTRNFNEILKFKKKLESLKFEPILNVIKMIPN